VVSMHAEVGQEAIIAEGSVVKMGQKVPSGVVVGGNPAKTVREISDEDKRFWVWGKQLYIELAREYIHNGMKRLDSSTLHKVQTEQ